MSLLGAGSAAKAEVASERIAEAAKRGFLRRTKATGAPETTTSVDNTETTTNKFTRRGNSKFKPRKKLPKTVEKNEIEVGSQQPSLNGDAKRTERPPATRKFVSRLRFGGANNNSTSAATTSTTTAIPTSTRRVNRIISRRRQSTTTTSTTTAPTSSASATTNEDEDNDSLLEIGDTDSIEDPTLESKKPKSSFKVQRRPLILKDSATDQNPSATNEEENKNQSKKYSASIKQNQLDDLVKKVQEESSTEKKTTIEDISPETAVAIAAHQLITAPIPSITEFEDDDITPTRNVQTTVEYKYTSREYNEYTNTDSRTPSYDEYQSTPIYNLNSLGNDDTTVFNTQTDNDATLVSDIPNTASTASNQDFGRTMTFDNTESEYDSPKIISTTLSSTSPSSPKNAYLPPSSPKNAYLPPSSPKNAYLPPKSLKNSYLPPQSETNTVTGLSFGTNIVDSFTKDPINFASSVLSYLPQSDFQSDSVTQNYIRSTNIFPETSTEFISRKSPSYVANFASTTYSNRDTFDETVLEENSPRSRISTTLSPPYISRQAFERTTPSLENNSPRTASSLSPRVTEATELRDGFRSNLNTNAVNIGYSGVPRGSSRFRNKKLIPVPVEDSGFSTVGYSRSSQDPSYFTRDYLLESPVTKTYDEEYQYLSPVTTPQTPTPPLTRKVIRKMIRRKISTTQRPTTTPSPPLSTTTVKPRRVPAKPFEKVPKQKKVYRPIANYDYYDDGDVKVGVKYEEGTKVVMHENGTIECLDIGNFPHPMSCKKFISCARIENGSLLGWEYICPKGLSFDPVGGICNWSAGLGCNETDT